MCKTSVALWVLRTRERVVRSKPQCIHRLLVVEKKFLGV